MIVRRLPKFVLFLLFAVYFGVGFTVGFKLAGSLIEEKNTVAIEGVTPAGVNVLVFTPDAVEIVPFEELETFTSRHQDYSFVVPEESEDFYRQKLRSRSGRGAVYEMEIERITEKRQLISFIIDDIIWLEKITYEATEKEVLPKTKMWLNWRDTPLKIFISTFCGAVTFLIFFSIYRKYLVK